MVGAGLGQRLDAQECTCAATRDPAAAPRPSPAARERCRRLRPSCPDRTRKSPGSSAVCHQPAAASHRPPAPLPPLLRVRPRRQAAVVSPPLRAGPTTATAPCGSARSACAAHPPRPAPATTTSRYALTTTGWTYALRQTVGVLPSSAQPLDRRRDLALASGRRLGRRTHPQRAHRQHRSVPRPEVLGGEVARDLADVRVHVGRLDRMTLPVRRRGTGTAPGQAFPGTAERSAPAVDRSARPRAPCPTCPGTETHCSRPRIRRACRARWSARTSGSRSRYSSLPTRIGVVSSNRTTARAPSSRGSPRCAGRARSPLGSGVGPRRRPTIRSYLAASRTWRPALVIAVLLAPAGVAPGGLNMAVARRADPYIGPRGGMTRCLILSNVAASRTGLPSGIE